MPTQIVRTSVVIAAVAWLVGVGGYGAWEVIATDAGDSWETPYLILTVGLVVGALFTFVALWNVSRTGARPVVRAIGLGVCGFAVLCTIVAWALPFWMTLLAVGYGIVALSGSPPWRRPVAYLAGAQLLGMVVLFIALAAEVGPPDEYGDYPAAFGISLVVTAIAMVVALAQLDRSSSPAVAPPARTIGAETT